MKRDDQQIKQWLATRKQQHLYRSTHLLSTPQQPRMTVDGKPTLSFCSNDYLGLANHPQIITALTTAAQRYGVGAGASHLVNGHSLEHQKLEQALAEFTGREAALLFSTGYMANIGAVTTLMARNDSIFEDRLNHASLLDAGLLSGARLIRYRHNDMDNLSQKLRRDTATNRMLLSDGVFSMDGDIASIPELVSLSQQYQAWLMIDDAHGFGVLGKQGGGVLETTGSSQQDVPLLMATLGKAVGVSGAFIAGSHDHIELLKQLARTWIYTTAMPPAVAAACRQSLTLIRQESWRREKLAALIQQFKEGAKVKGLPLLPSETPIQPVLIKNNQAALAISHDLFEQGIMVTAIRPPTVPTHTARLRITLSASHSQKDIEKLLEALGYCLDKSPLPE